MKELPVAINFLYKKEIHHFHIACNNNFLVVGNGEKLFDLAIAYDSELPIASRSNSDALYNALHYVIQMFSTHIINLSEDNKKAIVSYIHARVIKVSNNLFEMPLRGAIFRPELAFATTVRARPHAANNAAVLSSFW